jgi:hypothetical protein
MEGVYQKIEISLGDSRWDFKYAEFIFFHKFVSYFLGSNWVKEKFPVAGSSFGGNI